MEIQPSVNHLFTDLQVPNQTPLEVLEGNIAILKVKSFFFSALEKTCYVALLTLVATVFAVSYNFVALTGAMPIAMAGFILASPILVIAPIKFAHLANEYASLAQFEGRVKEKLHNIQHIQHWRREDVEQFFQENGLQVGRSFPILTRLQPTNPHELLLPLIAQFQSLTERIREIQQKEIQVHARWTQEGLRNTDEERVFQNKIRFEEQNIVWNALEIEAIPSALKAATLLQIIENPSTTDLDVVPMSLEISGVGVCRPRSYAERMFGKANQNDGYFFFHPALQRQAITHEAIATAGMNPAQLLPVLYPRVGN